MDGGVDVDVDVDADGPPRVRSAVWGPLYKQRVAQDSGSADTNTVTQHAS